MIKIHKNSPLTDSYQKIPSVISEYWRISNSVLELLFNETFNPQPQTSSSSSTLSNQIPVSDKPYIYQYIKCNILLIPDKNVTKRLQIYRWNASVFACANEKFIDILDFTDSGVSPVGNKFTSDASSGKIVEYAPPKDNTWYDVSAATPTLPKDVKESDRSPYITYKTENFLSTNYPLVKMDQTVVLPAYPPDPIIEDPTAIFQFSAADFMMLDKLYEYKTTGTSSLVGIDFNSLTPLAKLIYIYIDAFLNNNFSNYDGESTISDGSDMLVSAYEKLVVDMIYYLKYEQYGIIYQQSDVINTTVTPINVDEFLIMQRRTELITVDADLYDSMEIVMTEDTFWDRKDIIIFRDGSTLVPDEDFTAVIDFSDPNVPTARIHLLLPDLIMGEKLKMIWSYVSPYARPVLDVDQ